MHNLKEIRKDFDTFKKALKKRNIDIDFSKLEKLDHQNRELIQKKENLEKAKNLILKIKEKYLEKENKIGEKKMKKKNILILKERKNFLKRNI